MNQYNEFLDSWNRVIGYETPAHHHKMTNFLAKVIDSDSRRGLLMAFRHSGKSTIVGVFAACVLYQHPGTRILILSAETRLATRMVMHIRHILENHPWCVDMIPKNKREWAENKITVNRPLGIREPSVVCQGVYGNITGMRADLIICDDVEVPNTCNTIKKRAALRERLRELDFILSPTGTMVYIGTPHTLDTIYRNA